MYQVALLTPPVPAAIATIAVEGPDAAAWISDRISLRTPMSEPGRVHYGLWTISASGGATLGGGDAEQHEQVVVCLRPDGVVEVNTHGGRAVVRAIIDDLVAAGAQETKSLSVDVCRSKLMVAAESALLRARTDQAASVLLDQFAGALGQECQLVHAAIERGEQSTATDRLRRLLELSDLGLHLDAPWRIVLAGPPNVGKSSLINAMIGMPRSIVHDQPGTTRDWVEAETALGGWPITITDTAGLRETSEAIEKQGVVFTGEQINSADWIVLVVDATIGWQDVHEAVITSSRVPAKRLVVAWNKIDHDQRLSAELPERCLMTGLGENVQLSSLAICQTSCRGEPGVSSLVHFFTSEIAPALPAVGTPVPFAQFIVDGLQAALDALESNDPAAAVLCLEQLL